MRFVGLFDDDVLEFSDGIRLSIDLRHQRRGYDAQGGDKVFVSVYSFCCSAGNQIGTELVKR